MSGSNRPTVAVIANTRKLGTDVAAELKELLSEDLDVTWTKIEHGSDATKATRKALRAGASNVLVCGGDGTVRASIQALVDTDVPLSVVPAGTANLFASGLGLPSSPEDVVNALRAGATRRIDTACCNDMSFAVMAGTGLDAGMIDGADDAKERLGRIAYVRAGVHEARHQSPFRAKVKIDGEKWFDDEATCVLVANLGTLSGGIEAFPDATPDDGVLDVAVVTAAGLREWGSLIWSAIRKRQALSGHAHLTQGSLVEVKLGERHRYELDGGSKGSAKRLEYSVRPASLTIAVPLAA